MSHPRYQDLEHSLANHGSFGATDLVARATDGKYFVKNIIHLNRMAEALTRDDLYQFGSIVKIRHPNLARVREALIVGSSKTDKEDKSIIDTAIRETVEETNGHLFSHKHDFQT